MKPLQHPIEQRVVTDSCTIRYWDDFHDAVESVSLKAVQATMTIPGVCRASIVSLSHSHGQITDLSGTMLTIVVVVQIEGTP